MTAERSGAGPLSGVRVVEIAQYVAGPMGAMMLADLGADVVKLEPPGRGDAFRTYGVRREGFAAYWINVNRGKRSVAIDFKDPADQARCRELLERADVLVLASRPGVLDRAGLDDASLAALNPRLVRLYLTGYGQTGPRSGEPVYDNLVQGLSALAAFQGEDDEAQTVAAMVMDKTTAIVIAQSVLAALVERNTTGTGSRIDVSLLDSAAYWNFPDMYQDRTFLEDDRRIERLGSSIVETSDGKVIISPVSGKQLGRSAEAFGHPEWIPEFKQIKDHIALMARAMESYQSVAKTMTTEEVLDRLREHDVPAAPVLDLETHLTDPQVKHNEIYETVHDDRFGDVRVVRHPAVFDGERQRAPFTAPDVGADVASVVQDWNLDWDVEE